MKENDGLLDNPADEIEDIPNNYDFSQGVRGKHAERLRKYGHTTTVHHSDGSKTVTKHPPTERPILLDPDIAKRFPTSEAVNRALRALIELTQQLPQMPDVAPSQAS